MEEKGEVILLNCSNCRAPLCEIWTTESYLEKPIKISVDCPHCEDKSFEKTIKEKFFMGSTEFTDIEQIETIEDSDSFLIQTAKTSRIKNYG